MQQPLSLCVLVYSPGDIAAACTHANGFQSFTSKPAPASMWFPGLVTPWHLHGSPAINHQSSWLIKATYIYHQLLLSVVDASFLLLAHGQGEIEGRLPIVLYRVICRATPRQLWPTPVAGLA